MKRLLALLTIAIGLQTAAASDLDFVLVNHTKRSFEALYITTPANKDWDGNLLANGQVLKANGELQVKFDPSAKSATWDVNIVDNEGLVVTFPAIKLAGMDRVTLTEVKGQVVAEIE
jgi:hypothetical protein